ncbi:MAG: hypothetical protein J2P53_11470 [Bradyrhizobiaceae bacterium]|nr:hypothetical protein [Bradyrhizobiaceae bacterium]
MNSRQNVSPSRGRWADEVREPPLHPSERKQAGGARAWIGKLAPLAPGWSWLDKLSPLAAVRPWLGKLAPTGAWPSLTELNPLAFARYLVAFLIGVFATVAWQGSGSGSKEETLALYSVRQSVDNLAAEVTKIRAVEEDILGKISAPAPQPVAAPVRNRSPGR